MAGAWWLDEPVSRRADDALGRVPFVEQVSRDLAQIVAGRGSTVVGLVGPWGSGKTSTLNLLLEKFDREQCGVAQVNPWALSGAEAVITELLSGIRAALPAKGKFAKGARRAIVDYGMFAVPLLSMVPVAGSSLTGVSQAALSRLAGKGTLQEKTEKVSAELSKLHRPVLVVVDDVDRLQPEELLALFKAVRVLGRLPYVHYLLAYDEHTVLDVLRSTPIAAGKDDRALAFLEKVVTLRLNQPPTRPDQAEQLFEWGLEHVLAEVGTTITQDQRRRLADEREALLRRRLTEPRSIKLFLAQLQVYLPLIGPGEVDLVDLIVLTFVRVGYPRLYQALSDDRVVLAGAPGVDLRTRLKSWRDPDQLVSLGVPDADVPSLAAALRRLFPLLAGDERSMGEVIQFKLSRRDRRRDRRACDPDYVDRYFALTPHPGDLPDEVLDVALREWGEGRSGRAAEKVRAILMPDPDDRAACALASRVLRRAEARTEELPPQHAAALVRVVLGLMPLPTSGGVGVGPDDAAVAWLAHLLGRVENEPPAQILELVKQPSGKTSSLWCLLRAVRLVLPEPGTVGSLQGAKPRDSPSWIWQFLDAAADAAWEAFVDHTQLGDAAPIEPAGELLRWLDHVVGDVEVNRRLARALDAREVTVLNVASRLVEVQTNLTTGKTYTAPFDGTAFLRRVDREWIKAERNVLIDAAGGSDDSATDTDGREPTWIDRRRAAAQILLAELRAAEAAKTSLKVIPSENTNIFANYSPEVLATRNSDQPDLLVGVHITLPAVEAIPSSGLDPLPGPSVEAREEIILDLLTHSPAGEWLTRAAQHWHVDVADWEIVDGDGKTYTNVRSSARYTEQSRSGYRQESPLIVGAHVRTGRTTDSQNKDCARPVLVLSVAVGIWIAELDRDRRPDGARHSEIPLPAALSLAETYELLTALVRCTTAAVDVLRMLAEDVSDRSVESRLQLHLQASAGLSAVIDLGGLTRISSPAAPTLFSGEYKITASALNRKLWSFSLDPRDVAISALTEWLQQSRYRSYNQTLLNIRYCDEEVPAAE